MAPAPPRPRVRLAPVLLALLLFPAAQAQAPGHGEGVDIVGVEWPSLAVAGHVFYLNVTVENHDAAPHDVLLFATLYNGTSATPCEGARALQTLSKFLKNVHLDAGQQLRVEGEADHWAQVVDGSRIPGDGDYEVCTWVRLGQCPPGPDPSVCFLDYEPSRLRVSIVNHAPQVAIAADPTRGTTQTGFGFVAQGSDADGDRLLFMWDFGDGKRSAGGSVRHEFGRSGTFRVSVNATDGFDFAEAVRDVVVTEAPSNGRPTPSPVTLAVVALAFAGVARRR
jgi:hypothetical protein